MGDKLRTLCIVLVSLMAAACASQTHRKIAAEELPLTNVLLNSNWRGTFHSSLAQGRIRLRFGSTPDVKGEIPYFHLINEDSTLTEFLAIGDGPCDYTPRYLRVVPSGDAKPATGIIHIYGCAKSAEEESLLSQNSQRKPKLTIKVKEIEVMNGRLHIKASLPGVEVDYELDRDVAE